VSVQQRLTTVATSDATGAATFSFAVCPPGSVMTGTVSIPAAGPRVSSNVILGATTYPPFLGANSFGPVQVVANETLQIVATGLTPNTQFTCVWLVTVEPAAQASSTQLTPYGNATTNVIGVPGAPPVATSGGIDTLLGPYSDITLPGFTAIVQTPLGAAADNYEVIEVMQDDIGAATVVGVSIENTTQGFTTQWQSMSFPGVGGQQSYYIPCPCQVGDELVLNARASAGGFTASFAVYGHGLPLNPGLLRPDGRLKPAGSFGTALGVESSDFTLIDAPGSNLAIMLKSIVLVSTDAQIWVLTATVNGSGMEIPCSVGNETLEWESGLLLDPDTSVQGSNVEANVAAWAAYDIVF